MFVFRNEKNIEVKVIFDYLSTYQFSQIKWIEYQLIIKGNFIFNYYKVIAKSVKDLDNSFYWNSWALMELVARHLM